MVDEAAAIAEAYEEAGDSAVEKIESLPQNAIRGDKDKLPEGVCNPVMQAADYDVVNVAFLSPDDTEYNTDTEGSSQGTGSITRSGLLTRRILATRSLSATRVR